jgi:hypothetical protein
MSRKYAGRNMCVDKIIGAQVDTTADQTPGPAHPYIPRLGYVRYPRHIRAVTGQDLRHSLAIPNPPASCDWIWLGLRSQVLTSCHC